MFWAIISRACFILSILEEYHCDAVWPGWGFVSEDPEFVAKLEEDNKTENTKKFSALAMFKDRDTKGVSGSDVADTKLNTTHQNQVS